MKQTFAAFNLHALNNAWIAHNQFITPTPIQSKVIPLALKGKDIIGISQTGTGKTHAFLIPILERIQLDQKRVQALITAPTRELAMQIFQCLQSAKTLEPRLQCKLISGGMEKSKMIDSLKEQPHIVVGTPGRIKDLFVQEATLRADGADILVVDEADMTMEFGFLEEVDAIAGRMKKDLQIMVFSATIPQQMRPFLKKYLKHPQTVTITDPTVLGAKIEHVLVPCKHRSYADTLLSILPGFQPYVCLIFANTRIEAGNIANTMRENGKEVIEIHGGLQPRQRKIAMKRIADNEHTYIVASDIAARGIDIEAITHVVSAGVPSELEYYVHRAGRTGRAGREGTCFLLYREQDEASIALLRKQHGIAFEHRTYKDGEWRDVKSASARKNTKGAAEDIEIAKIVSRKNEKVKPGYKKKKQAEIAKIKRKRKREIIAKDIKARQKERAKANQRAQRES